MHEKVYECPDHTANLNNMRLINKWCDLTIKVDGKEFRAHKNILSANLQYFDTMLSGDSFRESKEGVISMEYMDATDLEAFINYAYTGEISLTDDNALSLLETANYFGEDGIKQACIEFLEKHLKAEESLRAYNFAKFIDSVSLKKAAKSRILSNFENISQSSEYLDLDFESLADILSDGKSRSVESQIVFFEGAMRWILFDAKKRRIRMNDLLNFINKWKVPTDYFMKYVGSITNRNDNASEIIVKDLMSWYYTHSRSKHQADHSEKTLVILGSINYKMNFLQFYNFTERKWSQLQKFPDTDIDVKCNGAVLNDKFYFISFEYPQRYLNVFDPSTKLITVLSSSSSILTWTTLCACSRFVYLCGGMRQNRSSDQVLRYDPQTNSFENLPPMGTRRRCAVAIFYRDCLHVLGGYDDSSELNKVEKYDPDTNKWMELPPMRELRSAGHAAAALDGKLYVCGGFVGGFRVEVYDPAKNSWQHVARKRIGTSHSSLVAYEGNLLAIGGNGEKLVEVYDPSLDQWQMDDKMSAGLQIEDNISGFISSSCITD